ncbi:glutathione S-transferase [Litorimonas cladophorae]|uniref:Glutathione S-transferase n=1 Tax=Litorimonas cladophorae TaxID=1220491 RepID=A0A918NI17_9PROT|nr:glutathione S-transferase family protein [Litorimonas cladophorae]GGX69033.1 glutathione S-transferase [Litorimonas cladophorae]
MTYTLYAAPVSLFSGKARAYLRWKGVDFNEISPSTEIMKTVLLPNIGWPVIPVLQTPNKAFVQDTGDIISYIEANETGTSVYPAGPVQRFITELLHTFADQWLTLPAMHYRWTYNEAWVLEEFGKLAAPEADRNTQIEIGTKRGAMFKGMVPMLGITNETAPAIEASYLTFLTDLSAHFDEHDFLFGGQPSLADFALYGPLYAHLYRDPVSGDIMRHHAPNVARWVERLRDGDYGDGARLENHVVPETLWPLLARHNTEHLPVLQAINERLAKFEGTDLPRALGMVPFTVEGVTGQTLARPFSLFRLQAALDEYAQLNSEQKTAADKILDGTQGQLIKDFVVAKRLSRHNYKLGLA